MSENDNKKQIESCKTLFSLLKFLLQGNVTHSQALDFISKEEGTANSNSACVTLNKYINTLKIFGINIVKDNKCYKVLNPPYKIDFTDIELGGFNDFCQFTDGLEGNNYDDIKDFLGSIKARFSERLQMYICKASSKNETNFNFYYAKLLDKINVCQRFCAEDYSLEVIYYKSGSKKEHIVNVKPQELVYERSKIRLKAVEVPYHNPIYIPIEKIISLKQLPSKLSPEYKSGNVAVFKLRGRLAENYTIRSWEEYEKTDEDGSKTYINRNEDENVLMYRLLRYRNSCKVLRPKTLIDKIKEEVDKTLSLYE